MSKPPIFIGLVAMAAFVLLLIFGLAAVGPMLGKDKVNGDPVIEQPQSSRPSVDFGNPSIGPADAPVTIVYYGDYQCPSCSTHSAALVEALTMFEGRVRLIWKDLPNPRLHAEARNAAIAARCAGEQGLFWEYHDMLFANQNSLTATNYVIYARDLGLNQESFETCLTEKRPEALIDRDVEEAINLKISGTPYTFINNRSQSGALSAAELKLLIENELTNANQ